MIIWINGAFGSGKTHSAQELHRRLERSYIYDPENIGFFIGKNIPPQAALEDFQDYPMWRDFNFQTIDYIAGHYSGVIIVPMTITSKEYFDQVAGRLSSRHDLHHFILCASRETLLKRLASRLEGKGSWAARQIDRCIAAFDGQLPGEKIHTDRLSTRQVAEAIAARCGLALMPDGRSGPKRLWDSLVTKLRHIR